MKPLPELVALRVPTVPIGGALSLTPGETMIWDVEWHGFTIGRAELVVDGNDVRSVFKTSDLASSVASVSYTLTTILDRGAARPASARETLTIDGDTRRTATEFDATTYTIEGEPRTVPTGSAHTLHSALGTLRAWAQPLASSGYLSVLHAGRLYRIDVNQPIAEELSGARALRLDCQVSAYDGKSDPIRVELWLSATPARTPMRIEITSGERSLVAELIETTSS